ncbi:MAG TPA: DUF5615 family PIN-like protein [Streptosporangiaceae bacterium]
MKFKLDENLPISAASVLTAAGHDVDTVLNEHLAGRPDPDVVAASAAARRVLISSTSAWATSAPIRPAATPAS